MVSSVDDRDASRRRRCRWCFHFQQFCQCASERVTIDDVIDVSGRIVEAIETTAREEPLNE